MEINAAGIALIKQFEGCRLKAYQDMVGVWTIAYGHTEGVVQGQVVDQEEADALLEEDLDSFCEEVEDLLDVDVTDNQFSALVCFAYNVGVDKLEHSTILKLVNDGELTQAAEQFLRWDHAGGREIPGLLKRRQAERALFLS